MNKRGLIASILLGTLAQAQEARQHQDFRAPFTGRLTQAKPQVGALVAPGSAAAMSMGELLDTSELLLVAQIHEDSIARLTCSMLMSFEGMIGIY